MASAFTPVESKSSGKSGIHATPKKKRKRVTKEEEVNRDIGLPTPSKQKLSHVEMNALKSQLRYYNNVYFSAAIRMKKIAAEIAAEMEEARRMRESIIAMLGSKNDTHVPIEGCRIVREVANAVNEAIYGRRICDSYYDNSECTCARDK